MSGTQWPQEIYPSPAGRHRAGAGTWTPDVPGQAGGGRHSSFPPQPRSRPAMNPPAHRAITPPACPPARGSLPLLSQIIEQGMPAGRHAFPAMRGELPPAGDAPPVRPRRTKVTLTPPPVDDEEPEDEVRVYVAPAETGLGTFDLGSVPASVTPPRTWRKAAWFATASSGGVVLALLFAGSALVGKPAPDQAGEAWIPGLGGGMSTIEGERVVPAPAEHSTTAPDRTGPDGPSTKPGTPSDPARRTDPRTSTDRTTTDATDATGVAGSVASSPVDTTSTDAGPSAGFTSTPTTETIPRKPPSTPAPYSQDPARFTFQQAPDPKSLAEDSQAYFDQVTENPQAAYAMTTGDLAAGGPEGLERKYVDFAYFQVKYVQVHQYDGRTVCTVQAVYKDGRQTTEQRTLTFQQGRISSDGS